MQFRYSSLVDPSEYDDEGLCAGYTLRINRDQELVDLGTIRAQEDWNQNVGAVGFYKGGLGPQYSFISVAVPECLPDRIEIMAYVNEMIFLHDDIIEDSTKDKAKGDELNDILVNGFLSPDSSSKLSHRSKSGRETVQRKLMQKMVAIDRDRALRTLNMWAEFLSTGAGRRNHTEFHNLDDFLQYRILDVGKMYWVGVLTFGMALNIPDDEMDLCSELCHAAWLSCGLINDLYSWPKERQAAVEKGATHVNNSVWVLMKQHSIDEKEAIERLRGRIRDCMVRHLDVVEQCKHRTDISPDLGRFVEAMQYSMIANVVFSRECPRYNEGEEFNERQLRWMKGGTPASPGVMGRGGQVARPKAYWFHVCSLLAGSILSLAFLYVYGAAGHM